MSTMVDEFDFTASEGVQVAQESNKGGDFQREVQFLTLKADPASVQQGKHQAIVRLVTEYEKKPWMFEGGKNTKYNFAWLTVAQHYAPTKPKPAYAREGAQWPEKMFAVCRKDKVFTSAYGGSCFICDQGNRASDRSWALGIEREQVIENGQVIGIRDKMREVLVIDEKGDAVVDHVEGDKKVYAKKWVPAWVVLNYGYRNFFNALAGQGQWNQTVMDRDYVIQRTGTTNNDTNYTFIPLDPITVGQDNPWGMEAGAKYDMGRIVGQDNGRPVPLMEALYPDMPDLRVIIADRTRDDYYGRWFVPGWVPEGFDPSKVQGGGQNGVQGGYQPTGGYQQPQGGVQTGYQPQGAAQPSFSAPQGQQQAPATPQPSQPQGGPPPGSLDALKNRVLGGGSQGSDQPAANPPQQ